MGEEERREPPLEMMSKVHACDGNVTSISRSVREANDERIRRVLRADAELSEYVGDLSGFEPAIRDDPLPKLDHIFDQPLEIGVRDFSQGRALQVIVPPYDYGDKNSGKARMFPDSNKGTMGLGADAGNIEGVHDDRQEGICWIGVGLYSSQTIQVRVSPMVFWSSMWNLHVLGFDYLTTPPSADWKASVQSQAYDEKGPVTSLLDELLVHRRMRKAPGTSWAKDDNSDGGVAPGMQTFLTIPAGTTRWFNVLAHGVAEVDYTWQSQGAAQCGMDVNVNLIVVERL